MVHHLVLFKLKSDVDNETVDSMMRQTRIYLLRIPEILGIRCGKRISAKNEWAFFLEIDVSSMEKLEICADNSNYYKYHEEIIKPNVVDELVLDYETDPSKDVQFS